MLTVDSEKANLRKMQDQLLATRHMTGETAKQETRAAGLVERKHESVANAERQRGKGMTATVFMAKLRTINSNLVMEPHPHREFKINADKACIYLLLPNGKKEFVIVCENDFMPEWSVMDTISVRRPDGKVEGMWKTVQVPGHEVKRGWRTVLVRLIHKGLVSLSEVERVFGVGDRETWRVLTGKGPGMLLI